MTWLRDIPDPVWVFLGVLATALIAAFAKRRSDKAAAKSTAITQEQNAGTMALDLARALRDELDEVRDDMTTLRSHQREVEAWYDEHRRWDEAVKAEIERLEPGASRRLPRLRPMPHLAV